MGGLDTPLGKFGGDTPNFLDRPTDQERRGALEILGIVFGGDGAFAWWRIAAIMAKASMTSETWRCQPCQERVSLWSRPSSVLAVSKLSSMAQR